MAQHELRLLASALALRRFTVTDLARATGAKLNTARSWLTRNRSLLREESLVDSSSPGRPKIMWRLQDEAVPEVRRKLDALGLEALANDLSQVQPSILRDIEEQLEIWRTAKRFDDESATEELGILRRLIRAGWEEFSLLFSTTEELPMSQLESLAKLEKEAGAGATPLSDDLRDVAVWLAESLEAMSSRAVAGEFGTCVMRLRANVRTHADRVKTTAAALAAPVWSDEGLTERGVTTSALILSARVADLISIEGVLTHIGDAIGSAYHHQTLPGDAQAVLCGLIDRPRYRGSPQVADWMAAARHRTFWRAELAPVILLELSEGDFHWSAIFNMLGDQACLALSNPPVKIGRLRRRPLEYSAQALKTSGAYSLANGSNVQLVEKKQSEETEVPLDQIAQIYSYRPPQETATASFLPVSK